MNSYPQQFEGLQYEPSPYRNGHKMLPFSGNVFNDTTFGDSDTSWEHYYRSILTRINAVISQNKGIVANPTHRALTGFPNGVGNGFLGSIAIAHDLCIYAIPASDSNAIKFNPYNNYLKVLFGSESATLKSAGACYHPDGKIYATQHTNGGVSRIEPQNRLYTKSLASMTGDNTSCCVGITKKIYSAGNSVIQEYDPQTNLVKTFGSCGGSTKLYGLIPHPNGKIYGVGTSSGTNRIVEIDPIGRKVVAFGAYSIAAVHTLGGALAGNGCMYYFPYNGTTIIEVNPYNMTCQAVSSTTYTSNGNNFEGAVLAPDGNIYGVNYASRTVQRFNPYTKVVTTFGSSYNGCCGGLMHPNGKLYIANSALSINWQELDFTDKLSAYFDVETCLHPALNRGL